MKGYFIFFIIGLVLIAGCIDDRHLMGDEPKPTATLTAKPTPTATPTPKPTMNETTTVKIVYEGTTTIKDALADTAKTSSDAVILKEATDTVMSAVTFPYNVTSSKVVDTKEVVTTFKIVKYRCDEKKGICGYWIEATRDGEEVYTNSPIYISPPPYLYTVSSTFDEKTNEETVVIKEDPKLIVEFFLQRYVDGQPLGKAVSYEE